MSKNLNVKVLSGLLSLCMLPSVSADYNSAYSNESSSFYDKAISAANYNEVKNPSVSADYNSAYSNESSSLYDRAIGAANYDEVKTPEKKWPKIVRTVGEVVTGVSVLTCCVAALIAGNRSSTSAVTAGEVFFGSMFAVLAGTVVRWVGLASNKIVNGHFYDV